MTEMKKIWKFDVPGHNGYIQMPKGSRILTAGLQESGIKIWAIVKPSPPKEWVSRFVNVYGTGHPLVDLSAQYAGTVFDGSLVWHVFVDEED